MLCITVMNRRCSTGCFCLGSDPNWRARIAHLNDTLRQGQLEQASVVITSGVQSGGEAFLAKAGKAVVDFNAFSEANNPYGERDFRAFKVGGQNLFWKIDYFDPELKRHTLDAANPHLTHRVLNIMLASEY